MSRMMTPVRKESVWSLFRMDIFCSVFRFSRRRRGRREAARLLPAGCGLRPAKIGKNFLLQLSGMEKIQSPLCPESSKRSDKGACSLPAGQGIVAGLPSQESDKGEVSLSRASVRNVLSGRSGAYSPRLRHGLLQGTARHIRTGTESLRCRARHRDTSVPFLMERLNTGRPTASGTHRFGPKKTPYMPAGI